MVLRGKQKRAAMTNIFDKLSLHALIFRLKTMKISKLLHHSKLCFDDDQNIIHCGEVLSKLLFKQVTEFLKSIFLSALHE